jgi:RimK family alpha-L-glutamate ligase
MMKAWIIYNGALKFNKITNLVNKLAEDGKDLGIDFILIKNNEILPKYDEFGKPGLLFLYEVPEPEFIIFWDKDILLACHLEKMGYLLFNSSEAINVCDNKAIMHMELSKAGIRLPKTIVSPFVFYEQKLSSEYMDRVFDELGNTIILKEAHGSFGMQVYKIESKEHLAHKIIEVGSKPFILQEYIESSYGRDIRVNIVGDEIVGAMQRYNPNDFRANITIGGTGTPYKLTPEQEEIALKAHKALGLTFSGVDLLFGKDGEPVLCELNSNVNFISFEIALGINYGRRLLEYLLKSIRA